MSPLEFKITRVDCIYLSILTFQDLEYKDRLVKAGTVLYALTHETSDVEQKEAGSQPLQFCGLIKQTTN